MSENGTRCEIEQDGPRFRWVLMMDDRRMAKATRWWNTEEEAEDDYARFAEAVQKIQEEP